MPSQTPQNQAGHLLHTLHTSTPTMKRESKKQKLKSNLKPIHTFQDHQQLAPFQDHKVQMITPLQDHSHP